ncbi:MAG: hypothetical protein PHV47_02805 [Candidatus Pacebacteria bacterium]|nr:hypothetical protein [Candidatus Paceibacterota bacterium]MDD5621468.1 hypothetical protein [Candidatus Paceibacterota bacterium]
MNTKRDRYSKAIILRKNGYSLLEISKIINIAKSTASVWLKDAEISKKGIERLASRKILGKARSEETRRKRREALEEIIDYRTDKIIKGVSFNNCQKKVLCALLYMCEGTKNIGGGLHFVNSDIALVKTFLSLFRLAFDLNEKKFRVCLHLHEYHDPKKQIKYWSEQISIPQSQFVKPYLKPHTAKRIKDNYPGCANIAYHDSTLAKELLSIAKKTLNLYK